MFKNPSSNSNPSNSDNLSVSEKDDGKNNSNSELVNKSGTLNKISIVNIEQASLLDYTLAGDSLKYVFRHSGHYSHDSQTSYNTGKFNGFILKVGCCV